MNRIFLVLALLALAALVAVLCLGLSLEELRPGVSEETKRWATVHRLSGVGAALVVLLVDSIVVTYFIGTSRWCREVAETYHLSPDLVVEANRLKRATFPWAVISMLTAVGMVALGGAADPAAALQLPPLGGISWAQLHFLGALIGLALIALAFVLQWNAIQSQRKVIDQILGLVRAERLARGLEP